MGFLKVAFSRLRSHFRRNELDRDMDEELQFHLDSEIEDQMKQGLSRREAVQRAHQRLGGLERVRFEHREQRSFPVIDSVVQDVRFTFRTLKSRPGFSAAIILVAALGIGSNTAIFSLVNTALLAPLPYPEPDKLIMLTQESESGSFAAHSGRALAFLQENWAGIGTLAAKGYGSGVNLATGTEAIFVSHLPVSAEYFPVLGVAPLIGRAFTVEEDLAGGPNAVILSHRLWRETFQSDRTVMGTAVRLGGTLHTVVGVMPESFESLPPVDLWVPLRARSNVQAQGTNLGLISRLADGVSQQQVTQQLVTLSQGYRDTLPDVTRFRAFSMEPYQTRLSASSRPALLMLTGAVGMVLLIACANVSSLLLARWAGRRTEIATRLALGSSRGRLVQQLVTEGVVLSVLGGIVGFFSYRWTLNVLLVSAPTDLVLWQTVETDYRVVLFLIGVSLLTGVFFAVVPALHGSRIDPARDLTASRAAARGAGAWARATLVVGEVALCVVLLIGSGLLIRTFMNLRAVDTGFRPEGILTAQMSMEGNHHTSAEQLGSFFDKALDRMRQLPGLTGAAVSNNLPIERGLNLPVTLNLVEGTELTSIDWRYTSRDYFNVLQIPLRRGRQFDSTDSAGSLRVAIVNEEFARRFYSDREVMEEEITIPETLGGSPTVYRIVGVVGNVKGRGLASPPVATMYVPYQQVPQVIFEISHTYFQMNWVFRLDGDDSPVADLREIIRELDPLQPFSGFRTMDEIMLGSVDRERFQMWLLTVFGSVALLLTVVGIYGLISFLVTQQTREIGIRMALGATVNQMLLSMTRHGMVLALGGVLLGTVAAVALTQLIQSFLFGVEALDPVTFGGVILLMLLVAGIASLVPSLRLIRLSPSITLREL